MYFIFWHFKSQRVSVCWEWPCIHSRGIDLVFSSIIETPDHTRKTRLLSVCFNVWTHNQAQVFPLYKCIHGLASRYLSNDVTMHVDIHGYDTRSAENMDLYIPRCTKEIFKRSFSYKGSSLWNKLPPWVKESTSLNDFNHNYRLLNGWIHPRW